MDYSDDTAAFLKEREERIGGSLIYRSFATWYGRSDGEKRDFGVFLYSDGKTLVIEDFERTPSILGLRFTARKDTEFRKLEIMIPCSAVSEISIATRHSAEASVREQQDVAKNADLFARLFRKTVTRMRLDDGTAYYLEIADNDKLRKLLGK